MIAANRQAGFTLLEMLVALALLALLATYTLNALRNVSRASVIHDRIESAAAVAATRRHLSQTIETARAVFIRQDPDQPAVLAFSGKQDALMLVAPADARLERGGLYVISYRLEKASPTSAEKILVTSRRLYRARHETELGNAFDISLLKRVEAIEFRYFGASESGAQNIWHRNWDRADALPYKISVSVSFSADNHRDWPTLVAVIPTSQ